MRYWLLTILLIASLGAQSAQAEAIGFVKTLNGGNATIRALDESERPAAVGGELNVGDTIRTDRRASLGLTLKDDTMMSVGPDTELTLEEYLFEPARGDLKLGSRLGRGTLQYVSGSIARLQPDAVSVKTPTGTIGVRGTQFVVRVGR
jgi:hypothetical protein